MIPFSPLRFGQGRRHLLAFHGAGQSPDIFKTWTKHFDDWTIWAFPLMPTHALPNSENYSPTAFLCEFRHWLASQSFTYFSVLGYSLGAKPAYTLTSYFPHLVEHLYLLAPEGIFPNTWYRWATTSRIGKKLFLSLTHYPSFLSALINLGKNMGFISPPTARIAQIPLRTTSHAQKLWYEWTVWHKFDLPDFFISTVTYHQVPISLVLGKNDTLAPNLQLVAWAKKIPSARIYWLDSSHEKLLSAFEKSLLKKLPLLLTY